VAVVQAAVVLDRGGSSQ